MRRYFDFAGYPARLIDICRFLDWYCHTGARHGRLMDFAFFGSLRVLRGLSSSCLVLLLLPRCLLSPRKRRPRRTTSRTQLRSHRNIRRNRPITPSLPTRAVITPRTMKRRRIRGKSTIPRTRVPRTRKRQHIRDVIIITPQRRNWHARISFTMRLWRRLNCGPWRSS